MVLAIQSSLANDNTISLHRAYARPKPAFKILKPDQETLLFVCQLASRVLAMTRRCTEPLPRGCDGFVVAVSLFTIALVFELLSKRLGLSAGVRSIIVNRLPTTAFLYLFSTTFQS